MAGRATPGLRLLALDPYHAGSHAAFTEGWRRHSRHRWTLLTCPGRHWRWRMRHAAVTLARAAAARAEAGGAWDAVLCTDMLDLACFRGLAPRSVARLPAVVYFHESQLDYPVQVARERDLHFAYTNLTTALAADACWFNSRFHRDTFLAHLGQQDVTAVADAFLITEHRGHAEGIPRVLPGRKATHDRDHMAVAHATQAKRGQGRA
ncbi:MAG: DUF3524 domain-containing protein, partial [Nitrospirae bacterium]